MELITLTKRKLWSSYRTACRLLLFLLVAASATLAQTRVESQADLPYTLKVSVEEISVIFHATDISGQPVNDLKASELDLFDNMSGPGTIVALHKLKKRPLRIGFLLDNSGSVSTDITRSRAVAIAAAQRLIQQQADSGLVIGFRRSRDVVQPWSHDLNVLIAGIRRIGSTAEHSRDGTGLFESLFSTCFYEFGKQQDKNQNVILLFSDGVDTASYVSLETAVDMCQHAHTAIYAFPSSSAHSETSTGPETLRKLTEQTGGRVIQSNVPEAEMKVTLDKLEGDLRDEYQLFYRPKSLKHDGSFHQIVLVGPPRAANIVNQSGYYAPAR